MTQYLQDQFEYNNFIIIAHQSLLKHIKLRNDPIQLVANWKQVANPKYIKSSGQRLT